MSKEHELPSDSDDDDEDYIPGGADSDAGGSEIESDGEAESDPENENKELEKRKGKGKGKGKKRSGKNNKRGDSKKFKTDTEDEIDDKEENEIQDEDKKKLNDEEEKKRADSLWADFMKDTPSITSKLKSKNMTTNGDKKDEEESSKNIEMNKVNKEVEKKKVKITKLFEFAGEEIRVEKEVPEDSAEARLSLNSSMDLKADLNSTSCSSGRGGGGGRGGGRGGIRKIGLGGISSVLGQLGKKAKISVLEKSKLDWDSYKKEENIEEEITTHNKGKGGYLEKQDFLQRADLRQFEIEKQLRTTRRSNR